MGVVSDEDGGAALAGHGLQLLVHRGPVIAGTHQSLAAKTMCSSSPFSSISFSTSLFDGGPQAIPLTATLEGGDLVVHYPTDARWPWRHVTDRLRPLNETTLIGLTYGLPLTAALPFLLHRDD